MKNRIIIAFIIIFVTFGGWLILAQQTEKTNATITPTPTISIPKNCSGKTTSNIIEGPYYKEGSPERTSFLNDQKAGEKLVLEGYVFDTNCRPVTHAWVDFWQADSTGVYDNSGFKLRGHQRTDASGKYYLETIIPGEYEARTPHIHAKAQANSISPQITTQLYFPAQTRNQQDPIFDKATMIDLVNTQNGKTGFYNFVIEVK